VVTGIVIMRKGENPSVVLKAVKEKIEELNHHILPAGVKIVPFYDRTWLMGKTLSTVFKNLVEGALLVSLVLYLFLSNLRATLAVVVVIPLSLLATFLGLKILGVPANLLSLGAMDFGIIVDGAVIVIENIMHRLAERGEGISEQRAQVAHPASHQRSGAAHLVLHADHHCRAHPHLCPATPRGPHLPTDGPVGHRRPDWLADFLAHACAAAGLLDAAQGLAARGQPAARRVQTRVPAGAGVGLGQAAQGDVDRGGGVCAVHRGGHTPGLRVFA